MFKVVRPEHKDMVIEISSGIWDGHDYVPKVFDKWVAEEKGEFLSIWEEDRMVGFAKTTHSSDEVAWLEGIRVHKDYRGKCYGELLAARQLVRAKEMGYTKAALSTYVENYASIHIIEKEGFKKVDSYKFLEAYPEKLASEIFDRAIDVKPYEGEYELDDVYYGFDWSFFKGSVLNPKGRVFTYGETKVYLSEEHAKENTISLVDYKGDPDEAALASVIKTREGNYKALTVMTNDRKLVELFTKLGAELFDDYELSTFVYELEL